jgi:hypothetical protein
MLFLSAKLAVSGIDNNKGAWSTRGECGEVSIVFLCVVVGLVWLVPVGFDGSGSFLFMRGYSYVCGLVWNLTSLAYKLRTSSVQVLHHRLVSKLWKN